MMTAFDPRRSRSCSYSPKPWPGMIGPKRIKRLSSTPAVRCLTCSRYSGSVIIARKAPALGYSAMKAKSHRSSAGPGYSLPWSL